MTDDGRLLYFHKALGYQSSGMDFHSFKSLVGMNPRLASQLSALKVAVRQNPYPKAQSQREKIDAHVSEVVTVLANRLSDNLKPMTLVSAKSKMNQAYVANVLESRLAQLPSGADPSEFFTVIGVANPEQTYSEFKSDVVKATLKTWETYSLKSALEWHNPIHFKNHFSKHLGENMHNAWRKNKVGSSSSSGKKLPSTQKISASAPNLSLKETSSTPASNTASQSDASLMPIFETPVRSLQFVQDAQSFSEVGCRLFKKHRRHHWHKKKKGKKGKKASGSESATFEEMSSSGEGSPRSRSASQSYDEESMSGSGSGSYSSGSSSSGEEEQTPVRAPQLVNLQNKSTGTPVDLPSAGGKVAERPKPGQDLIDRIFAALPAASAPPAPVSSRPPPPKFNKVAAPAPVHVSSESNIALNMLESFAKINPSILSANRPAFFLPSNSSFSSLSSQQLSHLQARPDMFLKTHVAVPSKNRPGNFVTLAGKDISIQNSETVVCDPALLNPVINSISTVQICGKTVTLIAIGQTLPSK